VSVAGSAAAGTVSVAPNQEVARGSPMLLLRHHLNGRLVLAAHARFGVVGRA